MRVSPDAACPGRRYATGVVIRWIAIILLVNYVLILLLYGRVFFRWW
jgi:hypothetical protein